MEMGLGLKEAKDFTEACPAPFPPLEPARARAFRAKLEAAGATVTAEVQE